MQIITLFCFQYTSIIKYILKCVFNVNFLILAYQCLLFSLGLHNKRIGLVLYIVVCSLSSSKFEMSVFYLNNYCAYNVQTKMYSEM